MDAGERLVGVAASPSMTFIMAPCDICGSTSSLELDEARRFGTGGVSVCTGCGFVHVKNRRPADEIAADWERIYANGGYTARWPMVEARLTYVAEWYAQTFGGWKGKTVLEIGAGEGRFLEMVRDRGAYPVGLEPSAEGCRAMRAKDIFAHHGTVETCGSVGKFDVVAILWTLENCQDCIGMLRSARANLAPAGHVMVATGSRILVPFKKPISTYFSKNPPDCHAFRFSANSLTNAMEKADLSLAAINNYVDSDWMVAAANATTTDSKTLFRPDDPNEVLGFFRHWARVFP